MFKRLLVGGVVSGLRVNEKRSRPPGNLVVEWMYTEWKERIRQGCSLFGISSIIHDHKGLMQRQKLGKMLIKKDAKGIDDIQE